LLPQKKTMEDWLGELPFTDRMNTPRSGVFCRISEGKAGGDDAVVVCRLCSSPGDPLTCSADRLCGSKALKHHLEDKLHLQRAKAISKERDKFLARSNATLRFGGDMKRFRCDPVLASGMCRYVYLGDNAALADVERRRNDLRASEPLVLLDLALWKASCELHPPESVVTPLAWKAWLGHGWKAKKTTSRGDPLHGIVALVAPFLGLKKESNVDDMAAKAERKREVGRSPRHRPPDRAMKKLLQEGKVASGASARSFKLKRRYFTT
jgi:hypothetical protein